MELVAYYRHLASYIGRRVVRRERAAAIVEYLLLLALIAIVCMIALALLGNATHDKYQNVANSVTAA